MPAENFRLVIAGVIALLVIWLLYRIKRSIKLVVKNEIFNNFPEIKHTIEDFQHRMEYIKTQMEIIERKLKECEARLSK